MFYIRMKLIIPNCYLLFLLSRCIERTQRVHYGKGIPTIKEKPYNLRISVEPTSI